MREDARASSRELPEWPLRGVGQAFPCFRVQDVSDESLSHVIELSRLTPAAWNLQFWRWIAVRKLAARKHLEAAASAGVPLSTAPLILVCLADTTAWKSAPEHLQSMIASRKITEEEGREALRQVREYYSASPEIARHTAMANAFVALQQLLVGAAECGLSACLITDFDQARVKTYLHIPDHFLVAALVAMGYRGEETRPAIAKPAARDFLYKEKYGEGPGTK